MTSIVTSQHIIPADNSMNTNIVLIASLYSKYCIWHDGGTTVGVWDAGPPTANLQSTYSMASSVMPFRVCLAHTRAVAAGTASGCCICLPTHWPTRCCTRVLRTLVPGIRAFTIRRVQIFNSLNTVRSCSGIKWGCPRVHSCQY